LTPHDLRSSSRPPPHFLSTLLHIPFYRMATHNTARLNMFYTAVPGLNVPPFSQSIGASSTSCRATRIHAQRCDAGITCLPPAVLRGTVRGACSTTYYKHAPSGRCYCWLCSAVILWIPYTTLALRFFAFSGPVAACRTPPRISLLHRFYQASFLFLASLCICVLLYSTLAFCHTLQLFLPPPGYTTTTVCPHYAAILPHTPALDTTWFISPCYHARLVHTAPLPADRYQPLTFFISFRLFASSAALVAFVPWT